MKKHHFQFIPVTVIISAILFSCEEKTGSKQTEGPHILVELKDDPYCNLESYAYTISAEESKQMVITHNLNDLLPFIKYDVSVHLITYSTRYKDSTVIASGTISIPLNMEKPYLLSYQHGTVFYDLDTPSELTDISSWAMGLPATDGYITFISDYIGYGTTKEIFHPYHLYIPTVDAVIDLMIAGKEFLKKNNIDFDTSGFFLGGFSEGGYATFSVQKEIECNQKYNLVIKASAAGAGAYDLEYMFDLITQNDYFQGAGYIALAISAYNSYYWNYPPEYFFNPDYINTIKTLLDGSFTESEIQNQLPDYLSVLLNHEFLEDFRNNPENLFRLKIRENSLNNCVLQSPTRFIHGIDDETMPFRLAQKTYNDLIALGVSPDNLTLQSFTGEHDEIKYLSLMLEWFDSLNN